MKLRIYRANPWIHVTFRPGPQLSMRLMVQICVLPFQKRWMPPRFIRRWLDKGVLGIIIAFEEAPT